MSKKQHDTSLSIRLEFKNLGSHPFEKAHYKNKKNYVHFKALQ